jgi:hypothetical protein
MHAGGCITLWVMVAAAHMSVANRRPERELLKFSDTGAHKNPRCATQDLHYGLLAYKHGHRKREIAIRSGGRR